MTDEELKQHVQNSLDYKPGVDASDIGVSADEGVVTLRGNAAWYGEKIAAERVALWVDGVKAVTNDLVVGLVSDYKRPDTEVAQAAVHAVKWHNAVPNNSVTVTVEDGWFVLGTIRSQAEKDRIQVSASGDVWNLSRGEPHHLASSFSARCSSSRKPT